MKGISFLYTSGLLPVVQLNSILCHGWSTCSLEGLSPEPFTGTGHQFIMKWSRRAPPLEGRVSQGAPTIVEGLWFWHSTYAAERTLSQH